MDRRGQLSPTGTARAENDLASHLMHLPSSELTADQVLQAFRHDAPSLFFGAVIIAVGLVAAAFSVIRGKFDRLLIYLAFLAGLYGLRMWMKSDLLYLTMRGSFWFPRVRSAIDFVIPLPVFLFLDAAGFLHRRIRTLTYVLSWGMGLFAIATLAIGPRDIFYRITGVLLIITLIVLISRGLRRTFPDLDFLILSRGLLIFAAFAVWENIRGVLGLRLPNIEPIGFLAFLGALGYVAARQTLRRDQELNEIQKELEVAKRMQLSILPGEFPSSANFRLAARYVPMTSVAGDFYDFIVADGTQAGILIADVSGHGVPAALIASMVKLAGTSQRAQAANPAGLLLGMNAALYGNTQQQFVTAAYVHLDAAAARFTYSAAGHPPMLLLRDGIVTGIAENGLMLAAFDHAAYRNAEHGLEPGDRLVLYTDGLIEATNARGDFFGEEGLRRVLLESAQLPPSVASDRIISAVQQWSASQDDDLTVLVCDYLPS
jgi:sigma-B regulation protein RsbU (phosphoserine phosphatase)